MQIRLKIECESFQLVAVSIDITPHTLSYHNVHHFLFGRFSINLSSVNRISALLCFSLFFLRKTALFEFVIRFNANFSSAI